MNRHGVLVGLEPVDAHHHGVAVEIDAVVAALERHDVGIRNVEILGEVEESGEVEARDRFHVALHERRLAERRRTAESLSRLTAPGACAHRRDGCRG